MMSTHTSNNALALARQWRPRDFQSVIGQEACCTALTNALDTGRLHHAYLFTGTRGVGKTTLARILAKCLNCEAGVSSKPCGVCSICQAVDEGRFVDLLEIDAASRTKVEDMRGLLDNVQYSPTEGRFKIYLIDEVHMLSGSSFNALLKTLEEPPPHVKFLLATTDPQKLPVTVLSRCVQFHLKPVALDTIIDRVEMIVRHEKVEYEREALCVLAQAAEGSVRDALSLLDQALAYGNGYLRFDDMREMLGLSTIDSLIAIMQAVTLSSASRVLHELNELQRLAKTDPDFSAVLTELLTLMHHIAIAQQAPEALPDDLVGHQAILALAAEIPTQALQLYYQIALMGRKDLPYAPDPKMGLQMILLRMVAFRPLGVVEAAELKPVAKLASESVLVAPVPIPVSIPLPDKEEIQHTNSDTGTQMIEVEMPSWNTLVPQLKLSGLVKALADHCVLTEWSPTLIRLTLEPSQKPLWNKRNETQLQEALSRYLGATVGLRIICGITQKETPAHQHQRELHEGQQAACTMIENDPHVQDMIKRLNAKIEQVTVTP